MVASNVTNEIMYIIIKVSTQPTIIQIKNHIEKFVGKDFRMKSSEHIFINHMYEFNLIRLKNHIVKVVEKYFVI
jgi:hypothetical protein